MVLNKKELINSIQAKVEGSTKVEIENFIEAFTEVVTETLADGGVVNIMGFGKFEVKERAGRNCVNPRTGETMWAEGFKAPKFSAGTLLKNAVRGE